MVLLTEMSNEMSKKRGGEKHPQIKRINGLCQKHIVPALMKNKINYIMFKPNIFIHMNQVFKMITCFSTLKIKLMSTYQKCPIRWLIDTR